MAHTGDAQQQALLRRAQDGLSAGASPDGVFAELADGAPELRAVAIAVCVAAGTSYAEAEKRWAADGEAATEQVEGNVEDLGWLLETAGFFDFHRPFDERERQISVLFSQAFAAHAGWRSGFAWGLIRKLQTGQFIDALALMAGSPPRPATARSKPSPLTYWTRLLEVAELLADSDDGRIAEISLLCRRHLDQLAEADPDPGD